MKILILAKDYPPLNTVGAQRPAAWFKYLNKFGHSARMITATYAKSVNDPAEVVRVRTDLYGSKSGLSLMRRKLHSFFERWLSFICPLTSRYSGVYHTAKKLIKDEPPDIIVATGEPFVLFGFASRLSQIYEIPWVADYRDPWTNQTSPAVHPIFLAIQRIAEKRWVRSATAVTAASPAYKERVIAATDHPRVYVVYNGHNLTAIPEKSKFTSAFRIAYSGRLYPHQPIESCMSAFLQFMAKEGFPEDVELIFFGLADWPAQAQYVQKLAGQSASSLRFFSQMAYNEYMTKLSSCQLFVLLSEKGKAWLNAKVFDYLVLPGEIMLHPAEDGVLNHLLSEGGKGKVADSISDMAAIFSKSYQEYSKGTNKEYPYQIERFSRRESTANLSSILEHSISTFERTN